MPNSSSMDCVSVRRWLAVVNISSPGRSIMKLSTIQLEQSWLSGRRYVRRCQAVQYLIVDSANDIRTCLGAPACDLQAVIGLLHATIQIQYKQRSVAIDRRLIV